MQLYTGPVAILIESALPLTLFGTIAAILQQLNMYPYTQSEGYLVCYSLFGGLFYSFCALSPHMIIFRVTIGRSFTKFPSVKDGVVSNPIRFAHQTVESAFLQSSFNREFGRNCYGTPYAEQGNTGGRPLGNQNPIIEITQEKRDNNGDVEKVE
ncbi:hypothetical protein EST38_g13532 [Candolleomyces aberdarensis]|uniref:Uncharacterized protein n=1 Tax=Candolleomyces aberdarensis TaxID=2316362 RepID=A0A4Q2D0R2_9AGAR|nr:hypothetical protein EST38_g13532 [Candolleomyces aberdarensis]